MSDATRRISLFLFLVAYMAFGLVFSGVGNGNTVPRIAMSLAMVERGSLYIDEFAPFTEDKGAAHGHYISDKAPGLSLLALPAVGAAVAVLHLSDADARWIRTDNDHQNGTLTSELKWVQWVATLLTSSLYTALAVVVLYRTALLLGVSNQGSLFAAIVYGFATPTWGWATTFFSHASCGAFMVFGFGVVVASTMPTDAEWTRLKSFCVGLLAGLLLGIAIVLELTSAPAVILIGVYGLWRSSRLTPERMARWTFGAVVGGLIAGAPFMLHNLMLFDNPLSVGYAHSIAPPGFNSAMAFTTPSLEVAAKLLIGGERGLLWLSPILVFAPLGLIAMWQSGRRATALLCISVFVTFLCINAAYTHWYAGASTGPRYISPALPFLALPFGWLWDRSGAMARWAMGGLVIVSATLCFAMASIQLFAPWHYEQQSSHNENVVVDMLLPQLTKRKVPNLVIKQMGASTGVAIYSYALLVGGGLLLLWLYSASANPTRRP